MGTVLRYACDDRLHDALLPCAQAARNEKRGYVAYRRLARHARRATAFDELRQPLMPLTYSKFSPYFFINVLYSYVRLALVNVLLVRTLAIWRVKREAKKANRNATET